MAAYGWLHQVLHANAIRETKGWELKAQQLQMHNDEAVGLLQVWWRDITHCLWAIQETHGDLKSKEVWADLCWSVGYLLARHWSRHCSLWILMITWHANVGRDCTTIHGGKQLEEAAVELTARKSHMWTTYGRYVVTRPLNIVTIDTMVAPLSC